MEDPFVARNDAAWSDGILIHVPEGVRVEQPIEVELGLSEPGSALATGGP